MKHTFTRMISLMLTLMLTMLCIPALAEGDAAPAGDTSVPEGYPALRIDPATGKPYDLGGQTIYLCSYYDMGDWTKMARSTPAEQARYDYYSWLQNTYHFKMKSKAIGDWGSYMDQVQKFLKKPDGSARIYHISSSAFHKILSSKNLADWSTGSQIDLTDAQWNPVVTDFTTLGKHVYGVSTSTISSSAGILYFNKSILEKAKVDWNEIYDMQKNGTWTWDAFETILKKVKKVKKVSPFTGDTASFYRNAVFSNGGDFFHMKDGKLVAGADSKKTQAALKWAMNILNTYAYKPKASDSWDYPLVNFKKGTIAFYFGSDYQILNADDLGKIKSKWGAVAFPMGPSGKAYANLTNEVTLSVIPNVYDQSTLEKMIMVYGLWNASLPTDDTANRIGNYLQAGDADQRTMNETLPILMDPAHNVIDKTLYLGEINEMINSKLLWSLTDSKSLSKLTKSAVKEWNNTLKKVNKTLQTMQK